MKPILWLRRPRVNVIARFENTGRDAIRVLASAIHEVDSSLSITPVISVTTYTGVGTLPQKVGGAVCFVLGLVGLLLAALGILPAWRASRVDPSAVLRSE